jgi:alpha-glucosidase
MLDRYDARFSVAEVVGADPIEEMKSFTKGETRLNSAYNFDFLYAQSLSPRRVRRSLEQWSGAAGEGWPSWAFSNHDAPRAVSRWAPPEQRKRAADMLLLLLLSLRGNVFLYQGEELGLPQAHVPFEHLKDPEAIANWPHTLGRDGARTPFPWMAGAEQAGFTTGEPWLPVDPAHAALAVDRQDRDPASSLNVTRSLIRLRRSHPALRLGDLSFLDAPEGILAFQRHWGEETVSCVFNLGETEQAFEPRGRGLCVIATETGASPERRSSPKPMPPWTGYWAV